MPAYESINKNTHAMIWLKRQTVHCPRDKHALRAIMREMDGFRGTVRTVGQRVTAAEDDMFGALSRLNIIEDVGEVDASEEGGRNYENPRVRF